MLRPQQFKIRLDRNENKIVTIYPAKWWEGYKPRFKAFSIQTLDNLPECHKLEIGFISESHYNCNLWAEIMDYIYKYGTKYQKSKFDMSDNEALDTLVKRYKKIQQLRQNKDKKKCKFL